MKQDNYILFEEVDPIRIKNAIKKRKSVYINYDSEGEAKGKRIIQPVAYGLSKAGNPVIRAFQPFGDTKTRVPHWKLFRVDRILDWKQTKNTFSIPSKIPGIKISGFNPNGDRSMSQVYVIADFEAPAQYERGEGKYAGLKAHNVQRSQAKQEQDPLYQLKKNIANSYMVTPEVMARIEQSNKERLARASNNFFNAKSANDMSSITTIGDGTEQVAEPVTKDAALTDDRMEKDISKQNNLNYNNVVKNGPVIKEPDIQDNTEEEQDEENGQQYT